MSEQRAESVRYPPENQAVVGKSQSEIRSFKQIIITFIRRLKTQQYKVKNQNESGQSPQISDSCDK